MRLHPPSMGAKGLHGILPLTLFGSSWTRLADLPRPLRREVICQLRSVGKWPELRGRHRPHVYVAPSGAVAVLRKCHNGLTVRVFGTATPSEITELALFSRGNARPARPSRQPALSSTRVQKPITS